MDVDAAVAATAPNDGTAAPAKRGAAAAAFAVGTTTTAAATTTSSAPSTSHTAAYRTTAPAPNHVGPAAAATTAAATTTATDAAEAEAAHGGSRSAETERHSAAHRAATSMDAVKHAADGKYAAGDVSTASGRRHANAPEFGRGAKHARCGARGLPTADITTESPDRNDASMGSAAISTPTSGALLSTPPTIQCRYAERDAQTRYSAAAATDDVTDVDGNGVDKHQNNTAGTFADERQTRDARGSCDNNEDVDALEKEYHATEAEGYR